MENFGQHLQFVYSVHCDLHCIKLELVLAQAAPIPPIGISTSVSLVPSTHPVLCEIKSGMRLLEGHIFSLSFIQLIFILCIQLQHNVHAGKLVQNTSTYG